MINALHFVALDVEDAYVGAPEDLPVSVGLCGCGATWVVWCLLVGYISQTVKLHCLSVIAAASSQL